MKSVFFAITICMLQTLSWADDQTSPCRVRFSVDGKKFVVSVENTSGSALDIFDSPSSDPTMPAFFWVKIKDRNNRVLSATSTNPDGFWTFLFLESTIDRPPLQRKILAPGQQLQRTILITDVLRGLQGGWSDKPADYRYLCKLRIYLDEKAERSIEFESDWMDLN